MIPSVGVIFLDRDGTINVEKPDYVKSIYDFQFIEGSITGIRIFSRLGRPINVITNQAAIGHGLLLESTLTDIHNYMTHQIEE